MLRISVCVSVLLCCHVTLATSQPRPMSAVPPVREISTLSPSDSIALVEAGARAALASSRGPAACVVGVDDSVGGTVGAAFRRAGRGAIAAMSAAADSLGVLRFALLGVRDGDTATVVLRVSGAMPPPSRAFWINDIDYYFVRLEAPARWRFVDRRLVSASDYVADGDSKRQPKCLNGRND